MITRKAGPALAAGCTMVLKPSEETPLSAFALAVLAERAGIPAGVFNIVSGDAVAIGQVLTESPVVRKLSFTGSTRVGKLLAKQSADTLKKLSLELGGNAPFIVFDDADIDAAVQGAMASKFRNTGQTCVCVNRFYVQDGIYDAFTQALAGAVRKMRVGDALQGDVEQGPLINQAALAKVKAHVADARDKGAGVLTGGQPHALGGTFYEPTVLTDATADMLIAKERNLRPGRCVLPFQIGRRSDCRCQRHAVRPVRLFLYARPRARVARGRVARKRDGRHQRRDHLDRGCAVRRRQAIRSGTRRLEVRSR